MTSNRKRNRPKPVKAPSRTSISKPKHRPRGKPLPVDQPRRTRRASHYAQSLSRVISTPPYCETILLYQPTPRWTPDHLRIANVEHKANVPISEIFDRKYLPGENDLDASSDFPRLSDAIQDPPWDPTNFNSPFFHFFNALQWYRQGRCSELGAVTGTIQLLSDILEAVYPDDSLTTRLEDRIPLTINELTCLNTAHARVNATIARSAKTKKKNEYNCGIPLCVVSHKLKPGDERMARYEIPQLLLQMNMAYNYNPTMSEYEAFVISFEKPFVFTFVRASATAAYARSIRSIKPADGCLKVTRTKEFCVSGRNIRTRREFLKCFMGLARYLVERQEFSFPMHTEIWEA
ncbi:hypothetical protein BJX70DRAFT_395704 [Aspergillus crustosus]